MVGYTSKSELDEIIDNVDCFIHSSNCLRSLTLTILSFGTPYLLTFLLVAYLNIILAGEYAYFYTFLCHISLIPSLSIYAQFRTTNLLILNWESAKKGNTDLLNDFMNRLIIIMCAFFITGLIALPPTGLVQLIMFYGTTIVLFDKLGTIKIAEAEVKQYENRMASSISEAVRKWY